jgi:hypothetical protein
VVGFYTDCLLSSLIIVKTTHPYSQNPLLLFHESESPTFLISLNLLTSHSILYWKRGEKRQNYVYVIFCTTRWWPGIAKDTKGECRRPACNMQLCYYNFNKFKICNEILNSLIFKKIIIWQFHAIIRINKILKNIIV